MTLPSSTFIAIINEASYHIGNIDEVNIITKVNHLVVLNLPRFELCALFFFSCKNILSLVITYKQLLQESWRIVNLPLVCCILP